MVTLQLGNKTLFTQSGSNDTEITSNDYPGTDQEAWRTYRQALRDITETQTPELDEFGNLTNVIWPEEPTNA